MSRLSRKNQITLPVDVLREAGMRPGDELVIRATAPGRVEVELAQDVVERFAGAMPPGTYPPGAAGELRRAWRRSSSTATS